MTKPDIFALDVSKLTESEQLELLDMIRKTVDKFKNDVNLFIIVKKGGKKNGRV